MTVSRLVQWTSAPLVVAALLLASPAQAQCETDARWQRAELNLGSLPAPIVENTGHLDEGVAFAGLGSTDTAVHFTTDGGVEMIMIDDLARVAFEPVDTDAPPSFTPGQPLVEVRVLGAGGPGTLPGADALRASGQWGDAVAEHRATGRTWRAVWSGPASDLDRVAYRVEGLGEATSDPVSGELRMTLAADPDQTLTLYPAKARVGDETTHLPFVASAEGVVSFGAPVPEGATVEMLLVFAPYAHGRDAVADGRGGIVGLGTTRDAVSAGDATSGRDLVVVRTDDTGRELLAMTVLASSGDDTDAGITAMDGETWIAGAAGAADFPIAAKTSGKGGGKKGTSYPSPFVARLDAEGHLVAGSHLRQHGLESAGDLALDADGRLFVAGPATATAETTEPIDLTLVVPSDEAAPSTSYAVVELSSALDAAPRVQLVEATASSVPLTVRPSCDGGLVVGLPTAAGAGTDHCLPRYTKHTYTPVLPPSGSYYFYDGFVNTVNPYPLYDQWGYHALRWKEYYDNWLGPNVPLTYDVVAASNGNPAVPIQQVAYLDNQRLNAIEANIPQVFNRQPAGDWLRNDAWNYLELAIGAAAYAEFWSSPTYANLRYDSGLPGGGFVTGAVAITETQWCSHDRQSTPNNPGPGGKGPVQLCSEEANCGGPNCKFPIDTWDDVCAASPFYDPNASPTASAEVYLHRFIYSHWDGAYTEDETEVYWQDVRTRFDQANPNRYYVADPPAEVDRAQSLVAEGVQRELARVVEDVPVTISTVVGGQVTSSETGTGLMRAVDRLASER